MADVSGKFFSATKVRTGVSPSSPGVIEGESLPPLNPPGSSLNEYVPYEGATQNVDLGEFGVDAGFVTLDTTPTNTPTTQGTIYWDDARSTAALIMNGTIQHIGQDTFFYVKNATGSSIPKGTAVRFAGTDGGSGHLLITPFLANGSVPSTYFMGVTAETIGNGGFGQVMHFGELEGINTSGFTAGSLLYASTTVAGGFQTTAPVAPNNIVLIAATINSKNNGAILVRPTYGSNINTDEGVKITSVADKNLLQYQSGTGLWENKTLGQVIGGTSSQFLKGDGSLDSTTYQSTADKGQPNGYASLDSNGKVPLVQINDALIGNVNFQGLWNAATNTPTLANPPSAGTKGYYYIVDTAGTFAGISFEVGDWIISNGSAWGKVDNTDAVSSVFGRTGNVTAANGDYTTAQVTESGNLYYTDARSRAALSFVAGSGAYNSSTGVITIPTNNNQIANGAGYITAETDTLQSVILRNGTTNTGFNIFNSNDTYTSPELTNVPFIYLYNTGITSTSNAVVAIRTNSATGGDPILSFDIGGVIGWSMGIDNSDSDKFKIANSWLALDSQTRFSMSLDGTAVFVGNLSAANLSGTNTGNVTIGTANGLSLSGQVISLGLASGSANGALSSTDWNTFNNKQNSLTLTTSGTSGAATLVGNTLNIPNYTESDTLQSVILRNGTTNTGFQIVNANNTYTTPAATNVPLIYMLNTGLTATSHSILALRTNQATGGDPFISFDIQDVIGWTMGIDNSDDDKFKIANNWAALDSNTRVTITTGGNVGIGTTTPSEKLVVNQTANDTSSVGFYTNANTSQSYGPIILAGTNSSDASLRVFNQAGTVSYLQVRGNGNILIGTESDNGARLQVSGTATFSSFITAQSSGGSGLRIYGGSGTNQWDMYLNGANLRFSDNTGTGSVVFDRPLNGTSASFTGSFELNTTGTGALGFFGANNTTDKYFRIRNSSGNFEMGTSSTEHYLIGNGAIPLKFYTSGTTRLTIASTGEATFSSSVTAGGAGSATSGTINLISSDSFIRFNTTGGTADKQKWDIRAISATGFEALEFRTVNDANNSFSTKMWLAHNGNVGIGTPSPNARLHVASSGVYSGAFGGFWGNGGVALGVQSGNTPTIQGFSDITQTNLGSFTNLSLNSSGGNVLIGTSTSIGSKVYMYGAANSTHGLVNINNTNSAATGAALRVVNERGNHTYGTVAEFRIESATDGDRPSVLFSKGGTGNNWSMGMSVYAGGHDNFAIGYRSSYPPGTWATSYLTIFTNGNVGINSTTDTGDKLRVAGNTYTNTIRTLRPDNDNRSVEWKLGTASGGTVTPNAVIRVSVDGVEINLVGRYV